MCKHRCAGAAEPPFHVCTHGAPFAWAVGAGSKKDTGTTKKQSRQALHHGNILAARHPGQRSSRKKRRRTHFLRPSPRQWSSWQARARRLCGGRWAVPSTHASGQVQGCCTSSRPATATTGTHAIRVARFPGQGACQRGEIVLSSSYVVCFFILQFLHSSPPLLTFVSEKGGLPVACPSDLSTNLAPVVVERRQTHMHTG